MSLKKSGERKYLIVGAGGTGGSIAGMMGLAGKDVTLIARGEHLEAMKNSGMTFVRHPAGGEDVVSNVRLKVMSDSEYLESGSSPDVIVLCTKSYSVKDVAPFIQKAARDDTVIIPILNGISMGEFVRELVGCGKVVDGCIYINGIRTAPGRIEVMDDFFSVAFGIPRDMPGIGSKDCDEYAALEAKLAAIAEDFKESGIGAAVEDDIFAVTLRKYAYVGAIGGTALYFDSCAGEIRESENQHRFFNGMVQEVDLIAREYGVAYDPSLEDVCNDILYKVAYDVSSSLVRDIREGKASEFDNLIIRPRDLGRALGLDMPHFDAVIAKCK